MDTDGRLMEFFIVILLSAASVGLMARMMRPATRCLENVATAWALRAPWFVAHWWVFGTIGTLCRSLVVAPKDVWNIGGPMFTIPFVLPLWTLFCQFPTWTINAIYEDRLPPGTPIPTTRRTVWDAYRSWSGLAWIFLATGWGIWSGWTTPA